MKTALCGVIWMCGLWVVPVLFAQATLPSVVTGPWQRGTPPVGWTFNSLGGPDYLPDYDGLNDGAAKLDTTGDFIEIFFDTSAATVSFWIRGLTFSGGTFSVEESVDGGTWTTLQAYAPPPTNATFQSLTPSSYSRYIRFIYTLDAGGNVGVDGISITRLDFIQPVISSFSSAETTDVIVQETVLGRTYVLDAAPTLDSLSVIWTPVDTGTGTGTSLLLQDSFPTNTLQFYRVRDATP